MARLNDDAFRIFISHKHENAVLASTVKTQLEELGKQADWPIDCFVSGEDIDVATNWDRKIKRELARSHLLVLLFTDPARDWDWCLYETGLYARFDAEDVLCIACLYPGDKQPPGPLGLRRRDAARRPRVPESIRIAACDDP